MPVRMPGPDGTEILAEEMDFQAIEEPWAIYRLTKDGTTVRLRATALKIFRVVDEQGNQVMAEGGEPVFIVRNTRQVSATLPSK